MAQKGNTLTEYVRAVHHKFGLAYFLALHAQSLAEEEACCTERALNAGRGKFLQRSASLAATDIYAKEPTRVAYTGTSIGGEEAVTLIAEANAMTQADAVATAYEAMEMFAKQTTAEYLYATRDTKFIPNKLRQRVLKHFRSKTEPENTKPWFRQLVNIWANQNAQPLFETLFERVPDLRDRETHSAFRDLRATHAAVEIIRHLKTHANGRVDTDRLGRYPADVRSKLGPCIQDSFLHDGAPWVLPSHSQAVALIACEAEYAQRLYDAVSRALNMKLEWTPGRDPTTADAY